MKTIILLLVFSISLYSNVNFDNLQSQDTESKLSEYKLIESKLIDAKLYRNNAELYHEVELDLKQGSNEYYISNISQTILDNTIISGSLGAGQVLSVDYLHGYWDKTGYDKLNDSIKLLKREIELVTLYQSKKNLEIEVFEKIPKSIPNANIKYTHLEIKEFSKLIDVELNKLFKDKIELEENKLRLNELKTNLEIKLRELKEKNTKNIIRLTINSVQSQKSKIFINYICSNAGWEPGYDIFLENIESKGELISKANIRQFTGIDWNNVNLTLNDGEISLNRVPKLWEWVIDYYKPTQKTLSRAMMKGSSDMMSYDEGGFSAKIEFADNIKTEHNQNYAGNEYKVNEKFNILNNTYNRYIRFKKDTLDLNIFHYAIPKIDNNTYIIAEIRDFHKYNLVEGEITTYLEGIYKGKNNLILPEKGLPEISFGSDKSIQVKRENLEKFSGSKFLSSKKETKYKYNFTITNNKKVKIKFKLQDHLPNIKSDDFELKTIDISGATKDYQGILTWEMDLESNQTINKNLEFIVKHPEGFNIRD